MKKTTKKGTKRTKGAKAASASAMRKPARNGKPNAERKPPAAAKPKRVSALDAAATVLQKAGEPMKCQDLIAEMAKQGLWSSPKGRTPSATLYAAILREIGTKGGDARFKKTDRGLFAFDKERSTAASLSPPSTPRSSGCLSGQSIIATSFGLGGHPSRHGCENGADFDWGLPAGRSERFESILGRNWPCQSGRPGRLRNGLMSGANRPRFNSAQHDVRDDLSHGYRIDRQNTVAEPVSATTTATIK